MPKYTISNYSKFKERDPRDTVFRIQSILDELELFPVLRWVDSDYDGARSNRLTLYPTSLGTNGKGTDELYATASAYAELMERMQNRILGNIDPARKLFEEFGSTSFPDEQERSVRDIVENPDPFTASLLPALGLADEKAQTRFLRRLSVFSGRTDGALSVVPFADPMEKTIQMVPFALMGNSVGSNGMAAGNTLEEAMVQALSEIFERAANRMLILGEAVPPEIPKEEIEQYSLYHLIEQVEAGGRYRVTVLDCSMGKGWPVAGLCIADLETGTFGLKLGAHPSFAVALERTLTEALQGRETMEVFTKLCVLGTQEQASYHHNIPNVGKVGAGIYPITMFSETPGWEYVPWTRWNGLDNRGFLREMLQLLKQEGARPLFRDVSYLGFPSCQILIPGFSHVAVLGPVLRRYIVAISRSLRCWDHFPELTDEEERRLLLLIRFNENNILENTVGYVSCRALSERYNLDRVGAFLGLKLRQFDVAQHLFQKMQDCEQDADERTYLLGMTRYAQMRKQGYSGEQACVIVRKFFREDVANRVCADVADLDQVMRKQFPKLNCYDCEHCELVSTGDCTQPAVYDVLLRIRRGMKPENVSQTALLEKLCAMYVEKGDGVACPPVS